MNKDNEKKMFGRSLEALTNAAEKIEDDFLKFLFLTVVVLVAGSAGIAVAYGSSGGILLLALVMLFILAALYLRARYLKK